ncbi:Programmed cell death 1 ligand 1 [Collichthys lucidus]|uniref:Programmed cell death 1 ligand 1 n=1 Tax=Collichthys lucidus TaxID=240159 RepID=A0A4U5VCE5_COLLU|nr:Programmed cell death 1 ligand 1 [Collichthys lucidus]
MTLFTVTYCQPQIKFSTYRPLFTVEAEQSSYASEFGEDVVMGCRFQPTLLKPNDDLEVNWHWLDPGKTNPQLVYGMLNKVEQLPSLDSKYRGRVRLLTDELKDGWAKLQISRLRINDSGSYQCFVKTGVGADYKIIQLSVKAPYKKVIKQIETAAEKDEALLICQSIGYPYTSVTWLDGQQRELNSSLTVTITPDRLFKVTSELRVRSSVKNNYTCNFTTDGSSATFHIPDEILIVSPNNAHRIVAVSTGVIIIIVVIVGVLMYRRQKATTAEFISQHPRCMCVKAISRQTDRTTVLMSCMLSTNTEKEEVGRTAFDLAPSCREIKKENEEERTIFNKGCMEENLGASVKAHYSDSFGADAKHHLDAFSVKELPQRLQNNEGQPVSLQALLPEAGEMLFLEGLPGSGKTTVAYILVSSWTEGATHSLSNVLDLSTLQLLLYVDCTKAKGDLFQEIMTQLSLREKISTEDELRTVLTGSSEALLLLDGYREGNKSFDESLKMFLSKKGGCRVLVTACPGHCPTLRDTVGTGGVLELQIPVVKY